VYNCSVVTWSDTAITCDIKGGAGKDLRLKGANIPLPSQLLANIWPVSCSAVVRAGADSVRTNDYINFPGKPRCGCQPAPQAGQPERANMTSQVRRSRLQACAWPRAKRHRALRSWALRASARRSRLRARTLADREWLLALRGVVLRRRSLASLLRLLVVGTTT
jgi:hypothetical protein